jgi:hypothetical protein
MASAMESSAVRGYLEPGEVGMGERVGVGSGVDDGHDVVSSRITRRGRRRG